MSMEQLVGGDFAHSTTTAPKATRALPLFSNSHKTAVVTGAAAGIGLAVAQGLAESGANVALWYHSNEAAHDRAREIEADYKVQCKAYQVDVVDFDNVQSTLARTLKDFSNRLDIFVANAAIPWLHGTVVDSDPAAFDQLLKADLNSVYYCAKAAGMVWKLQQAGGGRLENYSQGSFIATSSVCAHTVVVLPPVAPYQTAKAGLVHLVRSLAVEWVGFARANSVSPGFLNTGLIVTVPKEFPDLWRKKIPMGRLGEANEVKGAFIYLASDASSYTTGSDIVIDGGYCLP